MRLEVYGEKQEGPEKVVRLRLQQDDDTVLLIVVDAHGRRVNRGMIAVISLDRGMCICSGVDADIGLPLDSDGRIKTY